MLSRNPKTLPLLLCCTVLVAASLLAGCERLKTLTKPAAESPQPAVQAGIDPGDYFRIKVVDKETSRGIPCVKLTTNNAAVYFTDSAGVVAFREPQVMGKTVTFSVEAFGYDVPEGFLGLRGANLMATPGETAVIVIQRTNIAQRIYRATGTGIYADSILLGDSVPPTQDDTPIPVTGQDGGGSVLYKGRIYWFWGDTGISKFILGNYRSTGATSELPGKGGLDPDKGISYTYMRAPDGAPKDMVNRPEKPIWIGNTRVIKDAKGEHLVGNYMAIANKLEKVGQGAIIFNDATQSFDTLTTHPLNPVMYTEGLTCPYSEGGKDYFAFSQGWNNVRTPTDMASVSDMSGWEALSCLKQGARYSKTNPQLDRDASGNLIYGWKNDTTPTTEEQMRELVKSGAIKPEEQWYALQDTETSAPIVTGFCSINWNPYRQRWIGIVGQQWGKSMLGETWYFEGDTPNGPWVYGTKIISHYLGEKNTYSFYNPHQVPLFDQDGGRVIHVQGSFCREFSNAPESVPRYEYNMMMYRLELNDPRLFIPVPVYRASAGYYTMEDLPGKTQPGEIAFYAPDRQRPGTVPVYRTSKDGAAMLSTSKPSARAEVAFFASHATTGTLTNTVPLNEFVNSRTGERVYSTRQTLADSAFVKSETPVCRVWANPIRFNPLAMSKRGIRPAR